MGSVMLYLFSFTVFVGVSMAMEVRTEREPRQELDLIEYGEMGIREWVGLKSVDCILNVQRSG